MTAKLDYLTGLMERPEGEKIEFKEAKNSFSRERLYKYCNALANEKGGFLVLGVTDKRPRRVVGTNALENLEKTKEEVHQRLNFRVHIEEVSHPDGRVLIIDVPPRPLGRPLLLEGAAWMRVGERLEAMSSDQLHRIFSETHADFSAEVCPEANLSDLDHTAIEQFRKRWVEKSGNGRLLTLSQEQLLQDAELIRSGITNAAIILLGSSEAVRRLLPQCEVIFEYRATEASGPAEQRKLFRSGYMLFVDELWATVDLRNDQQSFPADMFNTGLQTFNEKVVREAVNNALCHRDYRLQGSIYLRQYPRHLIVESPGGLPEGVTQQNILWECVPRNRCLALAFEHCGLVERSGQGVNIMVEGAIRESKDRPDFSKSTDSNVVLRLPGEIRNPEFLRYMRKIDDETKDQLSTEDFLVLDLLSRDQRIEQRLKDRLPGLLEKGLIERKSRNTYILSRGLYSFIGKKGAYTRRRGLDKDTNKELLLKHIRSNPEIGSPHAELKEVLPGLNRSQIKGLLNELKLEGKVHVRGRTRAARWFPGSLPDDKES